MFGLFQREMAHDHNHNCCTRLPVKRGLWSPDEDERLRRYITIYGHGCWSSIPLLTRLQRCGKSCRLRWKNYLRPGLRRGPFSVDEARIVIRLHSLLGNRWAEISRHLPGRTDNEVKNFWNSSVKKKFVESNQMNLTLSDRRLNLGAAGSSRASTSAAPLPLPLPLPLPSAMNMNPTTTNFLQPNPIHNYNGLVNNFYPDNSSANMNAAPLMMASSAQPPAFEENIAGIDASFMAAPPSPMRYLENLIAEIESPSTGTGSSGSSYAISPAMPYSSGSSPFFYDGGFVSFWGGHQP